VGGPAIGQARNAHGEPSLVDSTPVRRTVEARQYHCAVSASPFQAQEIKSPAWAQYYVRHSTFALTAAPRIRALYEATYGDDAERSVLDVCCGVGTLAEHFLTHGYTVTGIDLSEPMLAIARQKLDGYLRDGQARLIKADAANFSVDGRFGLATCTFDALNMLQSMEALSSCFACVRRALGADGMFVFDLMTRKGFWLDYNYLGVRDTEDELYIFKSVYDGAGKATARLTGFVRDGDHWERFDEFRTPTLFPAPEVIEALHDAGWTQVHMTAAEDLHTPIADPEQFDRVFFVATGT
jgi:SAM-dependent methyltransferase